MTWLVTGGAGYIGSHVVRALVDAGLSPVVLDDLSSGFAEFVPADVPFVKASLLEAATVESTLRDHEVEGVIHIGGFKYAGVSVSRPIHTYEQNVTATIVLLRAMKTVGVDKFVFSSSAATYGTPDVDVVTEQTAVSPESPYGESKLIGEWLLRDAGRAHGLKHTSLRYFNVVGSGSPGPLDASPHNLFPLVFDVLYRGGTPYINGDDYPTPDGTCVRDYIHVSDLALAHVEAARKLAAGDDLEPIYNLGSGTGSSVRQIMDTIREVSGNDFTPAIQGRRPATRHGSWPPATWPPATWAGPCATTCATWSSPPGRPGNGPVTPTRADVSGGRGR